MISYSELMYLNSSATGKRGRLPGNRPSFPNWRRSQNEYCNVIALFGRRKILANNSDPEDLIWRYLGSF